MCECHGDEDQEIFNSSVEEVCEVLRSPGAWDSDGHDAIFWTERLSDADFFSDLGISEKVAILHAVMNSNSHWVLPLQRDIKIAVEIQLGA